MNAKKVLVYTAGAVAVLVIVWLILLNKEKDEKIEILANSNDEKDEINQKLKETIENSAEIPSDVKEKLELLILEYKVIDNNLSSELQTAAGLIQIKAYPKAIGVLTKIIENLLKEKYRNDPELIANSKKKGRKAPALIDYLEQARNQNVLSSEEFHSANALREIRNEDAHELNPIKTKMLTASAFLSAVDLILKLSSKLKLVKVNF